MSITYDDQTKIFAALLAYSATFQFHDFDEQTVDFNGSH
jgi:hypothetical protein